MVSAHQHHGRTNHRISISLFNFPNDKRITFVLLQLPFSFLTHPFANLILTLTSHPPPQKSQIQPSRYQNLRQLLPIKQSQSVQSPGADFLHLRAESPFIALRLNAGAMRIVQIRMEYFILPDALLSRVAASESTALLKEARDVLKRRRWNHEP